MMPSIFFVISKSNFKIYTINYFALPRSFIKAFRFITFSIP
nr:MAG TPA: hypothetical protein [Caudoviricetes sp.]